MTPANSSFRTARSTSMPAKTATLSSPIPAIVRSRSAALPFLRNQSGAENSIAKRPAACGSTSPPAPRCASNPPDPRDVQLVAPPANA